MRILITGPDPLTGLGGPSSVATELITAFIAQGDTASYCTFSDVERRLPIGIRHLLFLFRAIGHVLHADAVLLLDHASTGMPLVCVARLCNKPSLLRIGGDFLWESYVERTHKPVLLSDFYRTPKKLSIREMGVRAATRYTLNHVRTIAFTTSWQRNIWNKPYGLDPKNTTVLENAFPECEGVVTAGTTLLMAGRDAVIKNHEIIRTVWNRIAVEYPQITLDETTRSRSEYRTALRTCYAVLLPSLSDVSPNTIMEAIACGKPFIATRDSGIYDSHKDTGLFVEPTSEAELEQALRTLLSKNGYEACQKRILSYPHSRTWAEVAMEYVTLLNTKRSHH